jgi:peptidoglycan/xylan/chitin deacetylase (PgdA/CDA1 family)
MLTDNVSNNSIMSIPRNAIGSSNNKNKVVTINFDDSHKSQYTYAKTTLDKYGFKATFFEVCNWIGTGHKSDMTMTWHDIAALRQDGMDIESHTMNHLHLNKLSSVDLDYEIGQSRQCLLDHGINSTIFAYPYSDGSDNSTVVNTVAKYYYLARTDSKFPLTFLHFPLPHIQFAKLTGTESFNLNSNKLDVTLRKTTSVFLCIQTNSLFLTLLIKK